MTRIYRFTFAGALGAVIAWAVMEPTSLAPDVRTHLTYGQNFAIGLIFGLLVGLLLGVADAMSGLSARDCGRRVALGAAFGAAGGILGMAFGNAVYSAVENIAGPSQGEQYLPGQGPGLISFLLLLFGRGIGWAILGGFIGISQGVATGSTAKMVNGVVGGILGGCAGGCVFESMRWLNEGGVMNIPPALIRLIAFVSTGGAIGLFIGFLEEVRKRAWLIRLVGRNEGKEYSLYKQVTAIGRSEFCDIPIFDDPDVAERHAAISAQGERHFVEDLGSFYGTAVNGTKVSAKQALRDGDAVEVGKTRFVFHDKATARFGLRAAAGEPGVGIPGSQHICPFCGGIKDAQGNCECTVGSGAVPSVPDAGRATVQQAAQPTQDLDAQPQPEPTAAPAVPQAEGPRLVGISGPYAGHEFVLKPGQTEIGREATRDVGLPMDNTVSRTHARIAQEVTNYVVYDTGSTNGTFVNGVKVQRHELANGDVIQIGSTKFRFEM